MGGYIEIKINLVYKRDTLILRRTKSLYLDENNVAINFAKTKCSCI